MMISFCNSKGGVGKSTLAAHLAVWLFDQGFRVGVLDADKQRSSSTWVAEVEPQIEIRTADTPEECLQIARGLAKTCDFVVADGPAGLDDISRALLLLCQVAILPLTPSILDLRSVQQATAILRFAQGVNRGLPEGRIVLNRIRKRDTISKELQAAFPDLGVTVAKTAIRDLQAYRDAAQQGTVVARMGKKGTSPAVDLENLFREIIPRELLKSQPTLTKRRVANG